MQSSLESGATGNPSPPGMRPEAVRQPAVQLYGVGLVVAAALLCVGATVERPAGSLAWDLWAAFLVPPFLSVGATWIAVARVSLVSILSAVLGLVGSFLAAFWVVVIEYGGSV